MTKLNKMNAIELEELKSYYYDNYSYDDLLILELQESDKVDELMEELQKKDNIIKKIIELLEENKEKIAQTLNFEEMKSYNTAIIEILDKINELEGDNK